MPRGSAVQVLSQHFLFRRRTAAATHHRPSWNAITTDLLLATDFRNLLFFHDYYDNIRDLLILFGTYLLTD